jgi:hypothetical protein
MVKTVPKRPILIYLFFFYVFDGYNPEERFAMQSSQIIILDKRTNKCLTVL